ncbi:MAG: sensor histidine kinase [Verrucomicrobiota bacterium]
MNDKRTELSQLYQLALRQQLTQGAGTDLESARDLGRHAMTLGLETLDMARIHEIALVSLVLPTYSASTNNSLLGRAGLFFAEAITPIEQTHRGAREANAHLNQIVKTLSQRTLELADSVEELKQEILQRKAVEESLRASELTTIDLLEKSQQMQEELRHLSRQLLSVQEEERRKISRELHDVIAQTLTGINVRLAALKAESTTSTAELHKQIASTQRMVEKSVDIVHRFARELRPTLLDDLGLIPALQAFLKGFMEDTGIRGSLKVFAAIEEADGTLRTMLYRVAQEALTNVARHAKASRVEVCIESLDDHIRMTITDNGQGFEVTGNATAPKHNRLGLLGMRERVEMFGGTFAVFSAPGHSTTVRLDIPPQTPHPSPPSFEKSNLPSLQTS